MGWLSLFCGSSIPKWEISMGHIATLGFHAWVRLKSRQSAVRLPSQQLATIIPLSQSSNNTMIYTLRQLLQHKCYDHQSLVAGAGRSRRPRLAAVGWPMVSGMFWLEFACLQYDNSKHNISNIIITIIIIIKITTKHNNNTHTPSLPLLVSPSSPLP